MKKFFRKLFALDLGSTKFCIAGLILNHKQSYDLHIISIPSLGTKNGMICDLNDAQKALSKLVSKAESFLNEDISECVVGVSGTHIFHEIYTVNYYLNQRRVDQRLLQQIERECYKKVYKDSYEILHLIPISYVIDSRPSTVNPLGCSGKELMVKFFVVYADKYYLQDVVRLCNAVGFKVINLYSECLASAAVCLNEEQKKLGVVVADIGGGTTDCVVFYNSMPIDVCTLNIGGDIFTKDLAIGLNISFAQAERVKIFFGIGEQNKDQILTVKSIIGKSIDISYSRVFDILYPRIKEFSFLLAKSLLSYKGKLGAGIILTGGGSEIQGLDEALSILLKVPVQKSLPSLHSDILISNFEQLKPSINYSTKYSTVLGLLYLEIYKLLKSHSFLSSTIHKNYLASFINWIKELT